MSNSIKISQLPAATTPLTGAEEVALVQGGVTKQATVTDVTTVIAASSTTARALADRAADVVNVKDFGAVGDGTTDDTAAFLAAVASGASELYVPEGNYLCSTIAPPQIPCKLVGPGFTIMGGDYTSHRVNEWAYVSGAPTVWSDVGNPALAMSGQMVGKAGPALQTYIVGAQTAGQPATGYATRLDLAAYNTSYVFNSGHNQSTTDTEGRTGVPAVSSNVIHLGAGDAFNYYAGGYVNNPTPLLNSHWLADPALTVLAGGVAAVTDSANLVGIELIVNDSGNDVTGTGFSFTVMRNSVPSPNPKQYVWTGGAIRSSGTAALDAMYQAFGPARFGLDFSTVTFTVADGKTAVALPADAKINFNSTNTSPIGTANGTVAGNTSLYYDSASAVLRTAGNGLAVDSTTGGILFPRMTTTQRNAIGSPTNGLVIYNTTTDKLQVRAAGAWVDLH